MAPLGTQRFSSERDAAGNAHHVVFVLLLPHPLSLSFFSLLIQVLSFQPVGLINAENKRLSMNVSNLLDCRPVEDNPVA